MRALAAVVGTVLLTTGVGGVAGASSAEPAASPVSAPGNRLLVQFLSPVSAQGAARALAAAGAVVEESVAGTGFSAVAAAPGHTLDDVADALAASPVVQAVESEGSRRAAAVPNDPFWPSQSSYMAELGFPDAWDVTTGADDLVIAVLDSGIAFSSDLNARTLPGRDVVNNDSLPQDDYVSGNHHGTMVAHVAGAITNTPAVGMSGATWKGLVMPVKVIDAEGLAADLDIANGIVWATDNGADVINLSLGGPGASGLLQAAVDYANARNVVVVAAAGNAGEDEPHYPAACKGVLAVGATDTSGGLAEFSNRGPWVDMVAPGVDILTSGGGGQYVKVKGTSFSAPLVSGAALLVRAADRTATAAQVIDRLRRSATDLGAKGFDPTFGAGRLNAGGAVRMGTGFSVSGAGAPTGGYWMLAEDGAVYPFGNAPYAGEIEVAGGAVDLERTPAGTGYWVVNKAGSVYGFGAPFRGGGPALLGGEEISSISSTSTGDGYWLFSNLGRAFPYGDAVFYGDMAGRTLNGPVLDSIPTRSGLGYYMVGSDGGIFAFGDAVWYGSTAEISLNQPVRSLVPDPDGVGYWLVAGDGGVFAYEAPFRDSVPGALARISPDARLNAPITGMVAYGDGYLMVATDGGIFSFAGGKEFYGSLGANPPEHKVVAVAAAR